MREKIKILFLIYIIFWLFSIIIAVNRRLLSMESVFFLFCSGGMCVYIFRRPTRNDEKSSQGIIYNIILWAIGIYLSFAVFGRRIFMQGARFDFSFHNIIDFIVMAVSLFPLTPGLLRMLEWLSANVALHRNEERKSVIKVGLICGLLFFFIDFLLTLSYYPCTMTEDSVGHWMEATGATAMSDYSPIAFNLLLRGLFSITGNTTPYIFVLFQTLVLSMIIGDTAAFLYRRGTNFYVLVSGSILFALIPSTYMLLLYLSKNPLTGILCLGMVLSLLQIIIEPKYYLSRPIWYIKTVLLVAGVYLIRENNVVIIIPLIGFVIWFLFSHKDIGRRILIVAGGVACIIALMTQGIYRLIEYRHVEKNHETIRPLLAPVGSALQQKLSLPEDILEITEKVLPTEEWQKRYNPFNSDYITWGSPKPHYDDISLKEAFDVYFKMFRVYPDVVIKDRMDGMDCIWDIHPENIWVIRCPTGIIEMEGVNFIEAKLPDGIIRFSANMIRTVASKLFGISQKVGLVDLFIWRNGFFVFLFFIIALYLFQKKKARLLWAVMPSVFILLTYVLVIAWQMFFYLWFFPLSVIMFAIVGVVESGIMPIQETSIG